MVVLSVRCPSFSPRYVQDLFRDEEKSEFVVVTIPSMLAVAETERLVEQLREQVRYIAWLLEDVAFSCVGGWCSALDVSDSSPRRVGRVASLGR